MIIIDKSNSKKLENLSAEELKKRILLTENKIAKAKKEKTSKKEPTPKVKQPFTHIKPPITDRQGTPTDISHLKN